MIHGPPGTGKSQTIANLIAALVARGRKVLFVAEKRAAIDAVLSRLKGVDLGELVLDIHEGTRDRQRIARDLGDSLDLAQRTAGTGRRDLHRRLVDRQRRLTEHVTALHEAHPPWGLTPFAVQSALLGIPGAGAHPGPACRPRSGSPPRRADEIRDELREFAHLGGFAIRPASTPWFGAALRTTEDGAAGLRPGRRGSAPHRCRMLMHVPARAVRGVRAAAAGRLRGGSARMRLYERRTDPGLAWMPAVYSPLTRTGWPWPAGDGDGLDARAPAAAQAGPRAAGGRRAVPRRAGPRRCATPPPSRLAGRRGGWPELLRNGDRAWAASGDVPPADPRSYTELLAARCDGQLAALARLRPAARQTPSRSSTL